MLENKFDFEGVHSQCKTALENLIKIEKENNRTANLFIRKNDGASFGKEKMQDLLRRLEIANKRFLTIQGMKDTNSQ